jgi:hypothetical protein
MILARAAPWLGAVAMLVAGTPVAAGTMGFDRPAYAGAYEPQGVDERGLWMELDEFERSLVTSPGVLRDAGLNGFIKDVLCRTVGADRCAGVRVYVMKDRSFNASMAPNGILRVNTGLLARLHSEAELAVILGHEFAHFEQRHSLKKFIAHRKASDWISWLALAGAATAVNTGDSRAQIAIAFFAFSRAEEAEADRLGGTFVVSSSYRLCASQVWQRAMDEDDALRRERGLKTIRRLTPGLTDDHPTDQQRLLYFFEAEKAAGASGDEGVERYRRETDRILPVLFEPLVKGNDFAVADYVIRARGDAIGWSADLLALRGELYRQRGNPRDLMTVGQVGAPASAWRGLGLADIRLGDADAGHQALQEYLRRDPAAADAGAVEMLLRKHE